MFLLRNLLRPSYRATALVRWRVRYSRFHPHSHSNHRPVSIISRPPFSVISNCPAVKVKLTPFSCRKKLKYNNLQINQKIEPSKKFPHDGRTVRPGNCLTKLEINGAARRQVIAHRHWFAVSGREVVVEGFRGRCPPLRGCAFIAEGGFLTGGNQRNLRTRNFNSVLN